MRSFLTALFCGVVLAASASAAPVALDEESPWPRVRSTNGNTVTLHLPQVENWTSNSFKARAAVEVKLAKAKKDLLGVVWIEANGSVNHSNRVVTLDRIELTKGRFPEATDGGSNALAAVREVLPAGARAVSLDYLITALGFDRAAARQGAGGLKHAAPSIIWATNRTVLVVIDGEPALRPVPDSQLERVINTPALLVRYKPDAKFYLLGETSGSVQRQFTGRGRWLKLRQPKSPTFPRRRPMHRPLFPPPASHHPGSSSAPVRRKW